MAIFQKKKKSKATVGKHYWDLKHHFNFNTVKMFYDPYSIGELVSFLIHKNVKNVNIGFTLPVLSMPYFLC